MRSSGLVLFVCAGLLLSGGAILGGSAAWSLMRMSYYFWTTDLGVELGSCVMFIAGALLCLPTCWLATVVPYHTKSISMTATLITLATATMLMLSLGVSSASGLSRALREPTALNESMLRAMTHIGFDPAVRSSFSAMQIELKCCGVQSSSDWFQYRRSLPPACCGRVWNGKVQGTKHYTDWRGDQCNSPIYTMGCLRPALCELRQFVNSVTALASAIIIVMAVTLFAAAFSLVSELLDRAEPRFKPTCLRAACLQPAPPQPPSPVNSYLASIMAPHAPVTQV